MEIVANALWTLPNNYQPYAKDISLNVKWPNAGLKDLSLRLLMIICFLLAWSTTSMADNTPEKVNPNAVKGLEYKRLLEIARSRREPIQNHQVVLNIKNHPSIGSSNAKIVLLEFSDFQCPFCLKHIDKVAPRIREKLVEGGELLYVFMDYPAKQQHPNAEIAAQAARCGHAQGKTWEMRLQLYSNQKALHKKFLSEHAKAVGLNLDAFEKCMQDEHISSQIRKDRSLAIDNLIKGTPTFLLGWNQDSGNSVLINKKIVGIQSYEVFESQIRGLLKKPSIRKVGLN